MENRIYEGLFEIADKNMQQSGRSFTCPKAAFLYYIKNDPYETDVMSLMETPASNEEFLDIAYIAVLNRIADDTARSTWKVHMDMPEKEFRYLLIRGLVNSEEARLTGRCTSGYSGGSTGKRGFRQGLMEKLLASYRRMPEGIKNIIRKLIGAGEE